ncbi:MAG: PIN domain-containing protein [candidate division KSB1 bacterium]|jgi:predicted nucleic acid-binding protein|nr:PIN domain-containing protein [candidate division KSB1 bacterium]
MNEVFIDSDIILDLLQEREPHYRSSVVLFSLIEMKKIKAYTSPVIITNIYYIAAKLTNRKSALNQVRKLLSFLSVTAIDEKIMLLSMDSGFKDFEDAIQYNTAKSAGIPFLLTRNKGDYRVSDITVCTADEYLKIYYQK